MEHTRHISTILSCPYVCNSKYLPKSSNRHHTISVCLLELFRLSWYRIFIEHNEATKLNSQNNCRFMVCALGVFTVIIRSSDNDSTGFWPPGSLHTLSADWHIQQRDRLFMWIKILSIENILWGTPKIEYLFDVANMVKTAIVKNVSINNDALLNIQACQIHVWENNICSPIW